MPTRPAIIGHRGARGECPENTIAAFRHAFGLGLGSIEIDVRCTRDGVVIVTHDPRLSADLVRDGAGNWLTAAGPLLAATDYADISACDVGAIRPGSELAATFPDQEARPGQRIPRLENVLDLIAEEEAENGTVPRHVLIEVKSDPVEPVLAASADRCVRAVCSRVRARGLTDRITLLSFDWHVLATAARVAPDIARAYLTRAAGASDEQATLFGGSPWIDGEVTGDVAGLIARRGGTAWAPHYGDIDAAAVAAAHARGLRVLVWTVNAPADLRAMAGCGVDGVITDYPTRAMAVLDGTAA